LTDGTDKEVSLSLREDISHVGGGALPLQELPTIVLAIKPLHLSVNDLEKKLRFGEPPIISRISKDELILDMRTIFEDEVSLIADSLRKALDVDPSSRSVRMP
jgi:L-seryl-tRNA(Ser) seleniumtransferase